MSLKILHKSGNTLLRASGFSLLEAALVLSIVGLVVAGIWVAAARITEARQINDMAQSTASAIQRLREVYSGQAIGGYTDISNLAISMNLMPMQIDKDSNRYATPWSAYTRLISITINPTQYQIWIPIPNKAVCIKLTRAIILHDNSSEMPYLSIQDDSYNTLWQGIPTSAADAYSRAQTYCQERGKIGLAYLR